MAKVGGLASLSLTALVAACSPFGGNTAFTCDQDSDCQGARDGRCEPSGFCSFDDPACEGGRRYGELSGALANQCIGDSGADAGVDATPPEAGEVCYGATDGLARPCFSQPPTGSLMLTGPIDTDTSTVCATAVSNTTACVIAAASITIPTGALVAATGSRPLVLVATGTITVEGILDVASHRVAGTIGAGGNAPGCDAGTGPNTNGTAGGGGAGGSFGAAGGNGGNPNQGVAGNPLAITLRGGCPGQDGREGSGNATTRGLGGAGGGAAYLIAGTSITIAATGIINASGAGGRSGIRQRAGGGGGGSGGLVGLDAPAVTSQGLVFANGGGGGEGSGDNSAGDPGDDPVGIAPAAGGIGLSTDGGDGGAGGAGSPGTGQPGVQSADGGGGGGGVGAIRVFPAQALGGLVSPPPS